MSNSESPPTGTTTLPGGMSTDREVITLLREGNAVVYFDCPGFNAYVETPESATGREEIARKFIMWYNDDGTPEGWEQTSIDPLTLKRELRQREFSLVLEAPPKLRIQRESDGARETHEDL